MGIKIIVRNHSLEPQSFSIFNQAPSDSSLPGQLWWNTWGTADQVDAQTGETTFEIAETYYAICGAAPKALAKGLVISTSNSEVASLGTTSTKGSNWLINIPPGQGGLEFITNSKDSDIPGGFTINTVGDTFVGPAYPEHYCGLGRDDPLGTGDVVPVTVFRPDSNQNYKIIPARSFWIAYGSDFKGLQTAEIKTTSVAQEVDFTGSPYTTATVTLTQDNSWDVTFSN